MGLTDTDKQVEIDDLLYNEREFRSDYLAYDGADVVIDIPKDGNYISFSILCSFHTF